MTEKRFERIARIQGWSRRLRTIIAVALVSLPLATLAGLALSRLHGGLFYAGSAAVDLSVLSPPSVAVVAVISLLDMAIHLLPLVHLRRVFGEWSEGRVLTRGVARGIRGTGWALLLSSLSGTLAPSLSVFLTSAMGEAMQPAPIFGLELASLLAGGVTILVGLVMDEAARVAENAELTI